MCAECLAQPSAEAGIRTRPLLASPFTPYQNSLRKEGPISHLHSSVNKRLGHSVFSFIYSASACAPAMAPTWPGCYRLHIQAFLLLLTQSLRVTHPHWLEEETESRDSEGMVHSHTAEPRFTGSFRKHPPHCCSVPRWEPGARP